MFRGGLICQRKFPRPECCEKFNVYQWPILQAVIILFKRISSFFLRQLVSSWKHVIKHLPFSYSILQPQTCSRQFRSWRGFVLIWGSFRRTARCEKADRALYTGGSRIRVLLVNFTLPSDFIPLIVYVANISVSYFIIFMFLLPERWGI